METILESRNLNAMLKTRFGISAAIRACSGDLFSYAVDESADESVCGVHEGSSGGGRSFRMTQFKE